MVSDEQLLEDLREFADGLGETPTSRQMNEDGPRGVGSYVSRFGSWNKALKEAGLNPVQAHSVSEKQLLKDLIEFADELGETPTQKQMNENGPWSERPYRSKFGSWNQALESAGLKINEEKQYLDSKEELIEDLQEFADELGETPRQRQMAKSGPWGTTVYQENFGSWNQALKEAGLEPIKEFADSKEELIKDLQKFADELGETPTCQQMKNTGPWGIETYRGHFGSWTEALKKADLEPIRDYPVEPKWADDVENYYGESWSEMREKAAQRDDEQCRVCGDEGLVHVHHIKPRRCFEEPDDSNTLDNLITLCPSCHGRFENRWTELKPDEFEERARETIKTVK